MKNIVSAAIALLSLWVICLVGSLMPLPSSPLRQSSGWRLHVVRQLNGRDRQIQLPGQFQVISTKSWKQVVTVPYMVYMPEKDRLLMLANYDYVHRPFVLTSDDHGATWTDPEPVRVDEDGKPTGNLGIGLAYLGNGKALLYSGNDRWFSSDYGKTWGEAVAKDPASDGKPWYPWCPPLVERDPETGKVTRLAESGYAWFKPPEVEHEHQQGYIRFSRDEGKTWGKDIKVPQWEGVSEATLFRAGNGDLLAACRTDISPGVSGNDHFEGLGISVSKDDGQTWSPVKKLYDWGRHHPSLLLMPNGDVVMTYVVRAGYIEDKKGFRQFGIEAVVSHDNGQTWDLDHRYILHSWVGNQKGSGHWWPAPFNSSSSLLPDGSIVTVFGFAPRSKPGRKIRGYFTPRELGLVKWRLNPEPINEDREIRDAPVGSDLRNVFDPSR